MKRTPLSRSTPLKRTSRLRPAGPTKAKKTQRQKAFYSSAAWRRLRKEALERAGHRCQYLMLRDAQYSLTRTEDLKGAEFDWDREDGLVHCAETEKLQVHHRTNSRFGGNERPEDLIVYCDFHHKIVELCDHPHRHPRRVA